MRRIHLLPLSLLLVSSACSAGQGDIAGTWLLDSYTANGETVIVQEGTNAATQPAVAFDEHVQGNAGCNNFGDNGDYGYVYDGTVLTFPEKIPKDGGQCVPESLMSVEEFFMDVLWSGSDITVEIDGNVMTWTADGSALSFRRSDT